MTEKLLKIAQRLIKWDTDFPVNCYNGYAGLKELDAIIADGKAAVAEATNASVDELGEIVPKQSFQSRVQPWMLACFGAEISSDRVERCDRFIEEALELTQAIGYSPERAHALVDYVFGRPVGDPHQEVGGVMITLAAMCLTCGLDIDQAGEDELARIWTKVDAIRAKQAAKPTGSALPIAVAAQDRPASVPEGWRSVARSWHKYPLTIRFDGFDELWIVEVHHKTSGVSSVMDRFEFIGQAFEYAEAAQLPDYAGGRR